MYAENNVLMGYYLQIIKLLIILVFMYVNLYYNRPKLVYKLYNILHLCLDTQYTLYI